MTLDPLRCIGAVVASVLMMAVAPLPALANGRFPAAGQLVVAPTDPQHIAVETTYGFVETTNGGKDWGWTCEAAALYGGVLDPPIGLLSDGTLIAGVFDGLTVSSPDGCNLAFAGGDLAQRYMVDVAVEKADSTRAIALSSNGIGGSKFDTRLWETHDDAKTWAQAGVALPADFLALTGDVAPSDTNRVYASGFTIATSTSYIGGIARSKDRGATWEVVAIPGSDNASGPYIAAIDPSDAATLYVRLDGDAGKLLVSHDSGDTFQSIFVGKGKLLGFALSPDGKTVLVGGEADGIMRAQTSDFAFAPVNALHARCLTWAGDLVYACASEGLDGFTIGKSHDQGVTFEPIHHLSCLSGPLACPSGSDVATKCEGPWAITKQTLQTDTCATGSSTSASSSTGGGPNPTPGAGCCAVAPGSASTSDSVAVASMLAMLALGAIVYARRRRRRPRG